MAPALCHCGRPLRHTGRHWTLDAEGNRVFRDRNAARLAPRRAGAPRVRRLNEALITAEIQDCLAGIQRLRAEITERQEQLTLCEVKLNALRPLAELYEVRALPAPAVVEAAPRPVLVADAPVPEPVIEQPPPAKTALADAFKAAVARTVSPTARAAPSKPTAPRMGRTSKDYEPKAVSFEQVRHWIQGRVDAKGDPLTFNSWADLAAVNEKREFLELPLFKRQDAGNARKAS